MELLEGGLDPELLILDYTMPGMNGAGILDRIMALRGGIPVV